LEAEPISSGILGGQARPIVLHEESVVTGNRVIRHCNSLMVIRLTSPRLLLYDILIIPLVCISQ